MANNLSNAKAIVEVGVKCFVVRCSVVQTVISSEYWLYTSLTYN